MWGTGGGSTGTQAYGEAWYWDRRYATETAAFDWYQKYSSLSPLINLYLPPHLRLRVLVVGCGNSAFSQGMVEDGYDDVTNVDISPVVIQSMNNKYSDIPQLKFIQMDVRNMSGFQSASFDAVIDKGTLDSILCGNNARQNASKMLEEVFRVLKDKGVYILVTYGAPIHRLPLLKSLAKVKLHVIEKVLAGNDNDQPKWELIKPVPLDDSGSSVEAVLGKNPDFHYIYVCTKDQLMKVERDQMTALE